MQGRGGMWEQALLSTQHHEREDKANIYFMVDNDRCIKLFHDLSRIYQVEIIHYDLERGLRFPDVFLSSRRRVKIETVVLDLNKKRAFKKTFPRAHRRQPDLIIQKALEKVGEANWGFFERWSSTMAEECALVDEETYYRRGERLGRIIHSNCSDLLYDKIVVDGVCYSSSFIDYIFKLISIKKKIETK